eukprot:jgi/Mesvir1/10364/Mv25222-RA.1
MDREVAKSALTSICSIFSVMGGYVLLSDFDPNALWFKAVTVFSIAYVASSKIDMAALATAVYFLVSILVPGKGIELESFLATDVGKAAVVSDKIR